MVTPSPDLLETLRQAQRFGFFGDRPIEEAADHSVQFVTALADRPAGERWIDLGAGGGLPGLVIAEARSDIELTLLDRRAKRTDFLERAVRRLGFAHVEVRSLDAERLVAAVASGDEQRFDVAVARGFGPPETTLRLALELVADGGSIVISDPPRTGRWELIPLASLGLAERRIGTVTRFDRQH